MLKFLDKPRVVSVDERSTVKTAYLYGSENFISGLADRRRQDPNCNQVPGGLDQTPSSYHIRVRYSIDREMYVWVLSIDVAFEANHWSCFYDSDGGRAGYRETCRGNFHFYFLSDGEAVRSCIEDYEEKQVLRRLTRRGPEVFPKRRVE